MILRRALPLLPLVAALLGSPGCDFTSIDEYDCPPGGTDLTYENFGKAFFAAHCDSCHSAEIGEREGAPENYSFGGIESIRAHKERIFARSAAGNDSMPPGPDDPPREERDRLAEWLACGAP
jgi:mono/diheme cytochrome c family protein